MSHEHPSSADIDVAQLKEWRHFLKGTLEGMNKQLGEVARDVQDIKVKMAEGAGRMDRIDDHLEATDRAVEDLKKADRAVLRALDKTKKDPVAFWTSISAAIASVGGIVYFILTGQPPKGG